MHCSHSESYIWGATHFEVTASWLLWLSSSADYVQKWILISFLWDPFILGWTSKHPLLGLCKRFEVSEYGTFVLHPLSHNNSITKPHAWFLLSLMERLTIDFPSHFILSFIDVYKDTATRDKLIFPSAITQILCHMSISYPKSLHFSIMCAIDVATIRWSEAKLWLKRPRIKTATPPASFAPSTSAPYSAGGVTLKVVMVQL